MLPASFLKDGFGQPVKPKFRRLMIGTSGPTDSGKTEFALSIPGPGIALALDRNFDATLDNPNPPESRRGEDWIFKPIPVPLATTAKQDTFLEYWRTFYADLKKALDNKDARAVFIDGDSDSWELQRLAEFGKLTQVPPVLYTSVNAARRALIARCWDAHKVVIASNKIKKKYSPKLKEDGTPELDNSGKPIREWDGKTWDRQGFDDDDYLWHIWLDHMKQEPTINPVTKKETPRRWGVRIKKCKPNPQLEGEELWGSDCNFYTLTQIVYPNINPAEWGF